MSSWQTTFEDLEIVLKKLGRKVKPKELQEIFAKLDLDKIERAAMLGVAKGKEVEMAYEEIKKQIS